MLNLLQVGVAVGLEKQLQRSDLQMRVTGVLISNGEDAIVARGADSAAANIRVKPRGGNDVE
ncbi:MAG: hypothetical protein JOZ28_10290 [Candidatus Eremiobacteraeota bacterium]|nr:hypothetical protein [Candidatus Eremiobacteraeota bacterium]